MSKNKFLVTGAAGFIGSNIVGALLEQGEIVRGVDNFSTGRKENIAEFMDNPGFEFLEMDLTDAESAKKAVFGVDFVLHQAAVPSVPRSIENPLLSNNANITGTLNMLLAAKEQKVKKFVYASSSSIYGDNPNLPKQEDFPVKPISPYSLTKYAGERYCQIFWKIYGLPTVCLRYFNVFGPKQNPDSEYSAVIPKFIKCFLKDQTPIIFGTGEQGRDFTFVENVIKANLLAAFSKENCNGEVFNIACQNQTSLNQLVKFLNEMAEKNITPDYKPSRQGDVPHSLADISKAKAMLEYEPKIQFKEGLEKTFKWYKKNGQ